MIKRATCARGLGTPYCSDLCVGGIIRDVKGVCGTPLRGDLPGDVMRNAEELLKNEDYSLFTSILQMPSWSSAFPGLWARNAEELRAAIMPG